MSGPIQQKVLEELAPLTVMLEEGRFWDVSGPAARIRDFDARQALACPTLASAVPDPFSPTPAKCRRPVVVSAARRLLSDDLDLVTAVREALKDRDALGWAAEWLWSEAGPAERAVTAARALEELAEWRRSLPWPLDPASLNETYRWMHPERALLIETRCEARTHDQNNTTLHVISRSERPAHETDQVAYRALVSSLAPGNSPDAVVLHFPRTGHPSRTVEITETLLTRGLEVCRLTLEAALLRLGVRAADLARHPSWRCYQCPFADECTHGQRWLQGPGRLRSGLPPPPH